MSLIFCSECQNQISDKAGNCPHCGYPLAKPVTDGIVGETVEPNQSIESIDWSNDSGFAPQADVGLAVKKRFSKKVLIPAVSIAVVLIVAIAFILISRSNKAAQRQEYIDNLNSINLAMLYGAAEAEEVCNLTRSVWYNTIYKEKDSATDKYTRTSSGSFNDDFNTSLSILLADDEIVSKVSSLKANQEEVSELYKLLSNPTDEFAALYDSIDEMYSYYYNLTKLAISPTGSLTSYSESIREYDNGYIECYNKVELLIPED